MVDHPALKKVMPDKDADIGTIPEQPKPLSISKSVDDIRAVIDDLKTMPTINGKLPQNIVLAIGKLEGAIIRLNGNR